jgi:hypothetical protein
MVGITPEYGWEELGEQRSERVREQDEGLLPDEREDAPERVVEEQELVDRELVNINADENEARAVGQACGRCGAVILAGQGVRLRVDGRWVHLECPV